MKKGDIADIFGYARPSAVFSSSADLRKVSAIGSGHEYYPLPVTFNDLIADLFDGGAGGAGYNLLDPATWYRDEAMTQPVTASGQTVRALQDVSGNDLHAIQTTDSAPVARKTVKGWRLDFDGATDYLQLGDSGDFLFPNIYYSAGITPTFEGAGSDSRAGWGLFMAQTSDSGSFDFAIYIGNSSNKIVTTANGDKGVWSDLEPDVPYLVEMDAAKGVTRLNASETSFSPVSIDYGEQYAPLRFGVRGDGEQYYQGYLFALVVVDRTPPKEALEAYNAHIEKCMLGDLTI